MPIRRADIMQTQLSSSRCALAAALGAHSLAKPARLTAEETALIAVSRELSRYVRSPVAPIILCCSVRTKRVRVMELVSNSS